MDFDIHVWVAGEELVGEGAVFVLSADFVGFVDDGADRGIFVEEDGADQVFVREILVAEVEVGLRCSTCQSVASGFFEVDHGRTNVADDAESGGEFVLLGFREYGTHYIIWGYEQFCSIRYLCLAHTYGSSSSRSLIRDCKVKG